MALGLSRRLSFGVRQRTTPRDPITQGLVLAVAPGVADGFDFSGKNHSLLVGSQVGRSATATGPTRTTLAAADVNAAMLSVNDAWLPTTAITVLVRKRKQDTTARTAGCFGLMIPPGGITDRCGAHLPYSDGSYYWDFGGVTAGSTRVSVAGGTIDTLPHTFALTAGVRGMEIWRDGALLVTGAFSGTRTTSGAQFGLGVHGGFLSDLEDWEVFCVWDRQLGTAEIAAVTADPLRVVRPPRRRIRYVATSTATKLAIRDHALGACNGIAVSNIPFDFQPVLLIQDAGGATVTSDNTTVVTATITSGTGTLIGTVTKTAVAGIVDFGANTAVSPNPYACNFLGIKGIGSNTITYSAPGLTSVVEDPIVTAFGSYDHTVTGVGVVTCAVPGAAVFTTSQALTAAVGCNIIVSGTAYQLTVFDGAFTGTLAGSPTFVASTFTIASPAELPRATPSTTALTITGSTYLETAATIQARVNTIQAAGGNLNHKVRIANGQTVSTQLTVPTRAGGGTGWLQIESETLPCAFGTRCTPAMFTTQATWEVSGTTDQPIISLENNPCRVRLVGLNITQAATSAPDGTRIESLLRISSVGGTPSLARTPSGVVVERCYLHGRATTGDVQKAVGLGGADCAFVDNHIADIAAWTYGTDSNCFALLEGGGPFLIENNYLESMGENILGGGAYPQIYQLIPGDITIRRNHFNAPRSHQGDPTQHKNLTEWKLGRRILMEANVMENCWVGQQDGTALLIASYAIPGKEWCGAFDITIRNNFIRNAEGVLGISPNAAGTVCRYAQRIAFRNNVAANIANEPIPAIAANAANRMFLLLGHDVHITHNTMFSGVNGARLATMTFASSALRLILRDNISNADSYGIAGDTGLCGVAVAYHAPGGKFDYNALVNCAGGDPFYQGTFASNGFTPNWFPAALANVGLTNASIAATWATADPDTVCAALALLASSLYKAGNARQASDGTDVGANLTALRVAILGVWTGSATTTTPTPGTSRSRAARLSETGFGVFTNANRWR